jgi:hypothetical protein
MTERPPRSHDDLDLSEDSAAEATAGLSDWEHGFIDAYLFLHQVHGEPTHEELNRAMHALEHYSHTHHRRAPTRR